MTQDSVKDAFTFTWRIENFSMCPHRHGQLMTSPAFIVDMLEKKMFELSLSYKGYKYNGVDLVECMLEWKSEKKDPEEISIGFGLSLVGADMKLSNLWSENNQVMKKSDQLSCFFPLSYLFANKKALLPNDVVTLQFRIRPASDQNETPAEPKESTNVHDTVFSQEEVSSTVSGDIMFTKRCRNSCFLNTRIPVERRRITWTIKNFDSILKTKKRITVSVESKLRWKSALFLSCYAREDGNSGGSVRIDIQRKDGDFTRIFVRCKVFVLDSNDAAQVFQEGEHLFGEDYETWSFPPIIELSTLENSKSDLLVDGKLSLRFEFLISYEGEDAFIGPDRKTQNSISTYDLRSRLFEFQKKELLIDVVLRSEGTDCPVHKAVICAQSTVFLEMFSGDASENKTVVVTIPDIDADTVGRMVNFMYTDCLEDLPLEDAFKLYLAAHNYKVLNLKKRCATILIYNLSLSSACDILVLANHHEDSDLRKSVINFIRFNKKDFFELKQWDELIKADTFLCLSVYEELKTLH